MQMASWSEFEADAPGIAAEGRRLLEGGDALLATVRGDDPPTINPISVSFVDGHLYAFLLKSRKRADLIHDGRYALHAWQDPKAPDEFALRGRVRQVSDPDERATAVRSWSFEADESYVLFEFLIESAILGRRAADEWPPRYTTWPARAEAGSGTAAGGSHRTEAS
jgi:hypothetical protein